MTVGVPRPRHFSGKVRYPLPPLKIPPGKTIGTGK